MDARTPRDKNDLSDFERRLADWQPASRGLDADAMLFAAGQAAGRRGSNQLVWPALCALLAVQAAGLGAWAVSERAERQALASRLPERAPTSGQSPAIVVAVIPGPSYEPSPGDYLSTRRVLEQDPKGWLAAVQLAGPQALGQPPVHPAILTPRQRDGLFDQ
jgi:hypothetical protein